MNKWIKPSELPEGFWGECFVASKGNNNSLHHIRINMVKVANNIPLLFIDFDEERGWDEFNSDEADIRVMIIEYPQITLEDFK